MKHGNCYGAHRVVEKKGQLPQTAFRLDNNFDEIYDNEMLIDVHTLNIDSASFSQLKHAADGDQKKIGKMIKNIVDERGKMQNPVTGSGGVLIGKVERIGDALQGKRKVRQGERIVSLVSLSLTPLRIDSIRDIRIDIDQVNIVGKAVLFEKTIYSQLPDDLPEDLVLAALDVAGAPAQTKRLVKNGDTVFIIGAGGKSGMLCAYEARKKLGTTGKIIGAGHSETSTRRIKRLGLCDETIKIDAVHPLDVEKEISELTDGRMADLTINCVNVPATEMSSILATRYGGTIYFFNMATSFTRAALGAEGIARDVNMIIGNGYTADHAEITLQILRESGQIRSLYEKLFVRRPHKGMKEYT